MPYKLRFTKLEAGITGFMYFKVYALTECHSNIGKNLFSF